MDTAFEIWKELRKLFGNYTSYTEIRDLVYKISNNQVAISSKNGKETFEFLFMGIRFFLLVGTKTFELYLYDHNEGYVSITN